MQRRYFSRVHLNRLQDPAARLSLELGYPAVDFSLLWTKGRSVMLLNLAVSENGGAPRDLLTSPVSDDDGEITWDLGRYPAGTSLDISFIAYAVDADIPRLAAFAIQSQQQYVTQIAPKTSGTYKRLDQGTTWDTTGTYTVRQ